MEPNKSQQSAINQFKAYLEKHKGVAELTVWEIKPTDYGTFWIKAEIERTDLPETNVLRFFDKELWLVQIGKKGKIEVCMCPKAFEQFKGRYAFGFSFVK